MSFEWSPGRKRHREKSHGRGLSIAVTLISPLLAVLLSQYMNSQRKFQTTFAVPAPSLVIPMPSITNAEVYPQLPSAEPPRTRADAWQAFTLQPQKQAVAKRLIASADIAKNDPATQFVMLRRAKDVATEANDGQTAFQAIDAIAATFHADAGPLKMSVLTKLASVARQPEQHRSIAEQALELGDRALGAEQFAVARQLSRLAMAEAKQSLDDEILAEARRRFYEVAERIQAKERVSTPTELQQRNPTVVQKLDSKAKQCNGTDHGDDSFAAKPKRF